MGIVSDFFFKFKSKAALNTHGQSEPREAAYEYLENKLNKAIKDNDDDLLTKVMAIFMKRLTISINNSIKDADDKKKIQKLLSINNPKIISILKDFIKKNIVITPLVEILLNILKKEEVLDFLNSVLGTEDTLFNSDIVLKRIEILKHFEGISYSDVRKKAILFLDDSDDNLVIASIRFLKEYEYLDSEEKDILNILLEKLVDEDTSARIRMEIIEVFLLNDWAVSGHKKQVESILSEEYYLTSKAKIKKKL